MKRGSWKASSIRPELRPGGSIGRPAQGYNAARDRLFQLELRLLGIRPGRWTSAVVISRHNGLLANVQREIELAQAVRILGADKVKSIAHFQGGDPDLTVDPAVDLSLITNRILELYRAFREPVSFARNDLVARDEAPALRTSAATTGS